MHMHTHVYTLMHVYIFVKIPSVQVAEGQDHLGNQLQVAQEHPTHIHTSHPHTGLQCNNPHPATERTVTLTTASLYLLLLKPQVFYLGWIQKQPVIQQLPSVRHTDEAQQGRNSCLWLFHLCLLDDWGGDHWLS